MSERDKDVEIAKHRLRTGNFTTIDTKTVKGCPHAIMLPSHYRDDCTCKCDDKDDPNMGVWGYYWDDQKKVWVADEPDQEG